jgi:hypothetical protein
MRNASLWTESGKLPDGRPAGRYLKAFNCGKTHALNVFFESGRWCAFPVLEVFASFDEGTCAVRRLSVFSWNCARGRYQRFNLQVSECSRREDRRSDKSRIDSNSEGLVER